MKPHIVYRHGIWCCGIQLPLHGYYLIEANGSTPKSAYMNWREKRASVERAKRAEKWPGMPL